MKQKVLVILAVILLGLPTLSRAQDQNKWIENLDTLVNELPKRHINPFTHISEADFHTDADKLRAELPNLNDQQSLMRIAALVASIGDAHTSLGWPFQDPIYPMSLKVFDDGIYCLVIDADYADALAARLMSINGHPIDDVINQIDRVISHENPSWFEEQLPNYLVRSDVLIGLGIIDKAETVAWEFQNAARESVKIDISPLPRANITTANLRFARQATPRTESMNGSYWLQLFDDGTLYFKYNIATEAADLPFAKFTAILLKSLSEQPVKRLVIDLRNNSGGDSRLMDPLIDALKKLPINEKGKLFVIIGRRTFSSAVLNAVRLKQETNAVLIGEPTGGSPNHFGEIQNFALPNFDLTIYYSTKYFEMMPGLEAHTLMPDVTVPLTIKDYIAGIDPFYAAVMAYKPQ
jgi:hypothetical protein